MQHEQRSVFWPAFAGTLCAGAVLLSVVWWCLPDIIKAIEFTRHYHSRTAQATR